MPNPPRKTPEELRALRAASAARRAVVDEYGDLTVKLRPFKADQARLADLAKTIRGWYAAEDATEAFTAEGDHYQALLGPKSNETKIEDIEAVYDALGHDAFLAACSITLGALEKAGANVAALTVKEQTGSRSLTVTEIEA